MGKGILFLIQLEKPVEFKWAFTCMNFVLWETNWIEKRQYSQRSKQNTNDI